APTTDGCARIYNEFVTIQKTNFSYTDVKDCYESFPYDKDVASKTIDTLTGLLGGFYSFLDKAKEPPQPGFDFIPMDIIAELELFRNKSYTSLYDFTIDVEQLFYDLKDAHTLYSLNCFSSFLFYTNMTFYSVINDGKQIIKVYNDTIDQSNIDCEVTNIDGQEAYQVIYEFARDSVYGSRDLGVRFNIALDIAYNTLSFAIRTEIPENPDITYTLKCNNTDEFDVKRNWTAFSSSIVLNKFNDSKTYFDNICNPIQKKQQPVSAKLNFQEITKLFNGANKILPEQDQSVTIIRVVDKFISFFKQQDFGVVKIMSESPTPIPNSISDNVFVNVIQGFNELANSSVKKIVLDLSDNTGGLYAVVLLINLLLFPNTFPAFSFDNRLSEQMKLAITEQFRLTIQDNIFDMKVYVNAKTLANFTSADDFFGNNVYTRGGISGNYSNKYVSGNETINDISQFIQKNLITPLPWKPEDYIILTNGFCGSACSHFTEHAAEYNNVTTVAVGGIASNPLLSYSSFPGGFVYNSTSILDSLDKLGLSNNTLMPKPFPLTGMALTLPINEVYSKINPDELSEFAFRPADFRLFYNESNIRNTSFLWSQAAALIGTKSIT
ncbi:10002_t:CDS:2, partial [Cetraspora pellucida]